MLTRPWGGPPAMRLVPFQEEGDPELFLLTPREEGSTQLDDGYPQARPPAVAPVAPPPSPQVWHWRRREVRVLWDGLSPLLEVPEMDSPLNPEAWG